MAGLLGVSVFASHIMLSVDPSAAFYLIPYRAFELLIGCILPKLLTIRSRPLANALAVLGASLVLGAIFMFTERIKFPGLAALLPCVGAALIIWTGGSSSTAVARLLSLRPLRFTGKISYSLYLMHWPLIVFGLRYFPDLKTNQFSGAVLIAAFMLATFSYYVIETPFRRARGHDHWRPLAAAAASICLVAAASITVVRGNGFKVPANDQVKAALDYLAYDYKPAFRWRECFLEADQEFTKETTSNCLPDETGTSAMLWGDSHATHLYYGLKQSMAREGYSLGLLSASACAPVLGGYDSRPKCRSFNENAFQTILATKPALLILAASWPFDASTLDLLDETIKRLSSAGLKVVLLGDGPVFKTSVPQQIADRILRGEQSRTAKDSILWEYIKLANQTLAAKFANRVDVKFIPIAAEVCPNDECALTSSDGIPLHFDVAHLTKQGSQLYAKVLTPLILR